MEVGEHGRRRGFAGARFEHDAQIIERLTCIREHVHQVRDRSALVATDIADARLQQRLGDGEDRFAFESLTRRELQRLDFLGKRSFSHTPPRATSTTHLLADYSREKSTFCAGVPVLRCHVPRAGQYSTQQLGRPPRMARTPASQTPTDPGSPRFRIENSPFFLMNRTVSTYALRMERALQMVGADIPRWRCWYWPASVGRSASVRSRILP